MAKWDEGGIERALTRESLLAQRGYTFDADGHASLPEVVEHVCPGCGTTHRRPHTPKDTLGAAWCTERCRDRWRRTRGDRQPGRRKQLVARTETPDGWVNELWLVRMRPAPA